MRSAGLVLQKGKFDKVLYKIWLTQHVKCNQHFAPPRKLGRKLPPTLLYPLAY